MLTEDPKQAAYAALMERILNGHGEASRDLRRRAFLNSDSPHALFDKVATRPTQVTDADVASARAAGFSEDQVFELVICAAVGQSSRMYEVGLTALAEAVDDLEPD